MERVVLFVLLVFWCAEGCTNINDIAAQLTTAATPTKAVPMAYQTANSLLVDLSVESVQYQNMANAIDAQITMYSEQIQQRINSSLPWADLEILLQAQVANRTALDASWNFRQSTLNSLVSQARFNLQLAEQSQASAQTLVDSYRREMQRRNSARLSTGVEHTCMITTNDTISCWGRGDLGQTTPPPGTYKEVSVGDFLTCAVDSNDQLVCFGSKVYGRTNAPAGTFRQVSTGGGHACAISTITFQAQCWGWDEYGQCDVPSGVQWKSISAGFTHTCGVDMSGSVQCWGSNGNERANPTAVTQGRVFEAVSCGVTHCCAVTAEYPELNPAWALRRGQDILCWGDPTYGKTSPPPVDWLSPVVSVGRDQSCGINFRGQTICWGLMTFQFPTARYGAVSAGWGATCYALALEAPPLCTLQDATDPWGRTNVPATVEACTLPEI